MSLASDLVAAGLTVRTVAGWGTRGGSWSVGQPVGVMQHHTAPPVPFPIERLYGDLLKCNINVKPDGTVWLIAAKACNFSSGSGSSVVLAEVRRAQPPAQNAWERHLSDDTNGNPWFFNFENDHPGDGSPIPHVQLDAIVTATRVVLTHYGLTAGNVISHAEWTRRKRDPYWNGSLRAIEEIRSLLEEDHTMPLLPIVKGDSGEDVSLLKKLLNDVYGESLSLWPISYDSATASAVGRRLARYSNAKDVEKGEFVNGLMFAGLLTDLAQKHGGSSGSHDHDGRYIKNVTVSK